MNSGLLSVVSSALAIGIVHPIDVVKSNYQNRHNTSIMNNIRHIKDHGNRSIIRSFYRGLTPQLATYPIFYGVFFTMDELLGDRFKAYHAPGQLCKTLLASGVATFISNPFFVLKVRFQTDSSHNLGYYGYTKKIIREEGIIALQKGFKASLVSNLKLGLQFPLTYYLDNKISTGYESIDMAGASFIGKFATSALFYPTDLIRTQQRASHARLSMLNATRSIVEDNGIRGLWRGLVLYNCFSVPNYVLTMVFLKALKSWASDSDSDSELN